MKISKEMNYFSSIMFYIFESYSYFPHAICRKISRIKKGKSENKRDGFSLANHDLMSHSASEIDSGAIRRVNYTLVIARCERARATAYLSVK